MRRGISLVPALLPLLQTLRNLKQKPDFCRAAGVLQNQGFNHLQRARGRLRDTKPSSISAKGSTSTQGRWGKDRPGLPPRSKPRRAVRKHQNPTYWHRDVFFPLSFTLPQKETSFFNPSPRNTSAPQMGPICSAKLRGCTSALPSGGGRGSGGSEHPWVPSPVMPRPPPRAPTQPPRPRRSICWLPAITAAPAQLVPHPFQ